MRRLLLLAPVAALTIAAAACSSAAPATSPTPPPHDSLNIRAACQQMYGPQADVDHKDMNGQGQTGWYCTLPSGKVVMFTLANMQQACDHQHPGTQATNLAGTGETATRNNSQFRCEKTSGSASNSTSTGTNVGVSGGSVPAGLDYDGQNPGPGCGANGQVKNKYVITVPGSTRTVKLPGGKLFGQLVLRHSTICQTAWGEVFYPGQRQPPGFAITITIVRPHGPYPRKIPFTTSDYVSPAFSSMLANNRHEEGCVYATAHVSAGGRNGPTVTTPCNAS